MITSTTVPALRQKLTILATSFTDELPRITTFQLPEPTTEERERRLAVLAGIVRDADTLLDELQDMTIEAPTEVAEITSIAAGLRHAALLLIASYNPEQAWFWTPEWQKGERDIDRNRAEGRGGTVFYSAEEFEAALAAIDAERNVRADV